MAYSALMSVPSFWHRYTSASVMSSPARAAMKLSDVVFATSTSAAFKMVAFSRSSRLTLPISLEMEMGKSSPSTSRMMAAARVSWLASTGENTLVMATLSHSPFTWFAMRRSSSSSRGAISRPSNSCPPPTRNHWSLIAARSSAGQSIIGLMARVAGAPMRITATRSRRLRSTMAFVQCVVPSIA